MASRSDTSTNRISGISIAFSLLIYVAAWLAAPEYYFGIARDSDAALICYIVAALLLALSVVGFGLQLSDREVSAFLASLVSKRLPQGIWGTPSAQTWRALGDTAATFIVTAVMHLIGIEAFDATGIAGALVK